MERRDEEDLDIGGQPDIDEDVDLDDLDGDEDVDELDEAGTNEVDELGETDERA